MSSPQNSSPQSHHDPFTGWCTIIGAVAGLVIGVIVHPWLGWTIGLALLGWITGAFIDRARRN